MKYVFDRYIKPSEAALVLICDDLQAYNYIVMGRAFSVNEAYRRAKIEGENMRGMIRNVQRLSDAKNVRIEKWGEITGQDKYIELLHDLKTILEQDTALRAMVHNFVHSFVEKFGWRIDEESKSWETRYLLEEIAMSIFVTECLGYPRELWENAPNPEFPDPIGYLYESRPELVQRLTGKGTLVRKLEILEIPE